MIFGSNRLLSAAIAKSIAIGSIRLLSIAIVFSARAAIEAAPEWAESVPAIRFESREWAADVMAGAQGNASIAVEGGRLPSNATWGPEATHLVLNTVYVPSGITLTITTNCVVKFCPGTTIKVEDGGKLVVNGADGSDVILTAANDATVGEPVAGFDVEQSIAFDGIRLQSSSATFTDNGWLETRGFDYGAFPGISVNATEAVRNGGMAYVPFTLSGSSRDKAFSVEWEAVAGTATYGDDYTLDSGRISWNKTGDGTKTLAIPLNTANITGEDRTFTVRIKAARCANVVRREATVQIVERDGLTLEWADEWAESAPPIRFESREWAEQVMAGATNNAAIAIEGGRLQSNAVWNASSTHLVLNTVFVPSGVTLTITAGAIVKYGPGTTIKVEDGGKLVVNGADGNDVILTAANDATVGEAIAGFDVEQSIAFDGIRLQSSAASFTDNGWLETRGFTWGNYPSVSLNDVVAFRSAGEALLPVTVGGTTRNQSFTVEWEAVDGTAKLGEDYTLASGRITWAKSGDGTKTLRIPLVADHLVGSNTEFKVRLTVSRGANIARGECTVTIKELDTLDLAWGEAESNPPIRFESREWMAPVLAGVTNSQSIAIEGGRLLSNTTWGPEVTHLVLNDVIVPKGITLTITAGVIVKYGPGTAIKVEDGGKLVVNGADGSDVILTAANDATVGEPIAGFDAEQSITFDGIRLQSSAATFTDNGWLQTRGFTYGTYPTLTIHDATANRKTGMIYLPVTVSGSRNQAFTVDWATEDETAQFGRDYTTSNAGRLTWSKAGDGTKYITIPLAKDVVAGTNRTFKVKFVTARCCNVSRGEAVATIAEFENGGIESYDVVEWTPSEPSAEFPVNEGIKTQPLFLNDTETVQYSGKWQPYDANEAAVLRVTLETDNGATVLKEASPSETGAFDLDLKQYPVGYYTLKHEILNDLGETLATMQKTFSIADDEDVVLHGGVLASNEVWAADKVHVVYETVVVPSVYTIFIEPGAIVKFMTGTGIDISQGGAFFANRIVFTHINDDTVGGDTLNDGFTVAPPMDAYFLSGAFTFGDDTELRGITQNNALTGTIATQKTLSRGSTYRVSGTLTIASGGSLTIPPGTVLKMEDKAAIVVNSGATLNAIGTRAAPIAFTSIKDDTISGDTNGDGSNTIPQPGDWVKIGINGGTANFEFAKILYSSKNQTTGAINQNGGTVVFCNSEISHGLYDAVGVESGNFYMTNSIITDCLLAFRHWAKDPIVNSVIYDCGRLTQGGGQTFYNCVFSEIAETWEAFGFPKSTYKNCCFWNKDGSVLTGEGTQDALTVCGSDGNIWGDPLFVDAANGDFRVKEGSPCVDAADGAVAPELDFYGQPRITITDHGDELVGQLADIGVCEVMPRDVVSDIDLVPQSVRTTTNAVPGQLLFVKWEIANVGGREVDAAWRDTVSLVSESGREVVLGVKTTSSRIGVGGSVFCSGYFTVPAIAEGTWYPKVNVNSYHDIFEGSLAANNALTGERAVSVGLEVLDSSIAREGVINGGTPTVLKLAFGENDDNRMIKFDVPAGVKATWGFGFMPGGARSGASGSMTASGDGVMFRVPDGATDVYVILESDTTTTYNLSTESMQMTITSVTPATLPSSGTTTLTITGAGFGEDCEVLLSNAIGSYRVQSIAKDNGGNLIATVDCAALTAGQTYAVRVESGENAAELPGAVSVVKAEGKGILELEYDVPSSVRPGRVFTFTVTYCNTGNKDMCVPLLTVQDTGTDAQNPIQFSLDGERFTSGGFQFVGNDAEGGFGPLHPGDEVTLLLMAKIPPANNGSTAVSVRANTESDIMAKYTTEIDRYLTPAMKAEFAATTDAELKARGERMAQVFGANNGEMVQNFASLAKRFYECNGVKSQAIRSLISWGTQLYIQNKQTVSNLQVANMSQGRAMTLMATETELDTGVYIRTGDFSFLAINETSIDLAGKRVAVITHGLNDQLEKNGWMMRMGNAIARVNKADLKVDEVLYVNWSTESHGRLSNIGGEFHFFSDGKTPVSDNIPGVAEIVSSQLNSHGFQHASYRTFIGHSFGSHLLGYLSKEYYGGSIDRHIGLDTANIDAVLPENRVRKDSAKHTEYYRSSPVFGRSDAYAHENYIVVDNVANNGGFTSSYLSTAEGYRHSYAHEWLTANILAGDSGVGFWKNASFPIARQSDYFSGVINGSEHRFECIYPYGNAAYDEDYFSYPGHKEDWPDMYTAWGEAVDIRIDISSSALVGGSTHRSGETLIAKLIWSDEADKDINTINTFENIRTKITANLVDDDGKVVLHNEFTRSAGERTVDVPIKIPHDFVTEASGQHFTYNITLSSGYEEAGSVSGSSSLWEPIIDLYARDNGCSFDVDVIKGDNPIPAVNGETAPGFVIKKVIPYSSNEEFNLAVAEGRMQAIALSAAESKPSTGASIVSYCWQENEVADVESTSKIWRRVISATEGGLYPIRLSVVDSEIRSASVEGWLEVVIDVSEPGQPIEQPRSYDPNEMRGKIGLGDPETQRFVKPGEELTYTIYFENKTNATAAAQEVYVTNPLSEWLDWSTFKMHEVAFGDQIDLGLVDKSSGTSEVTMKGTNFVVRTELVLEENGDAGTRDACPYQARWYMRIVDPTTDTGWPADIVAGFLPPNDETHRGEGHITYSICVRADAPANLVISNSADIVFDHNPAIKTDPAWWNTVAFYHTPKLDLGDGVTTNLLLIAGQPFGELPAPPERKNHTFDGWYTGPNGTGIKATPDAIVPDVEFKLYENWIVNGGIAKFEECDVVTEEGGNAVVRVYGGSADAAASVKVYLTYNTAAAADIDLKASTVIDSNRQQSNANDSGIEATNLKFPLTLNWTKGEIGEKIISIPVKADKTLEDDEFFTLQLAEADGMELGDVRVCTVTIRDMNEKALKAAVSAYKPKKNEPVSTNSVTVAAGNAGGGFVAGTGAYTSGSKLTLTAEARPGWSFVGWAARSASGPYQGEILSNKAKWQIVVTNDEEYVAVFEKIPYVRGLADPADGGKVAGSGYCAPGKKVTLKATANKNHVFVGWVRGGRLGEASLPGDYVATTPSLVIDRSAKPAANSKTSTTVTEIDGDVTYFAVFKSDPKVTVAVEASDGAGAAPTGKGAGKYVAGTIAGAGKYAPGKKVALKATANKGYVFAGWDSQSTAIDGNRLQSSIAFAMPTNNVECVARFVTAEEDKGSIALAVDGVEMRRVEDNAPYQTNIWAGVYLEWPVVAGALSETTVKAAGLPAGLKLVQDKATKAYSVAGVPTAASKADAKTGALTPSKVKFTVTTAGKSAQTFEAWLTVLPLPAWAVGTFDGAAPDGGAVTLAVAANGKISGKVSDAGGTWTIGAASFDSYDAGNDAYAATVTGKSGKMSFTNDVTVAAEAFGESRRGTALGLAVSGPSAGWTAWQNLWKTEPLKTEAKPFAKAKPIDIAVEGGTVTLKFSSAGTATAAGRFATGTDARGNETVYSASCTAALVPDAEYAGRYGLFLYFPPKAGKFGGYAAEIRLVWDGAEFSLAE